VLYYLGRAYYANASYVKAVDALERYVKSQTILDRPLLPASSGSGTGSAGDPHPGPADGQTGDHASGHRDGADGRRPRTAGARALNDSAPIARNTQHASRKSAASDEIVVV